MRPVEFDVSVRSIAIEMIDQALRDLTLSERYNKKSPVRRDEVMSWFNARSQVVFGYGWCLVHSEINPNLVRKEINKRINEGYKKRWHHSRHIRG